MDTEHKLQEKTIRFAKIIRIITIAPIMALLTLSLLYWLRPSIFGSVQSLLLAVIFLTVFPVLGYPLQLLIPYYKNKGREGQRNLAIIMAVAGYIGGIFHAVIGSVSTGLWVIYLTYFISGLGVLVFNKLLRIRASGHACGVAGPIALLVYHLGPAALIGFLLLALVFYSSLKIKRHTLSQLLIGSCIPIVSMLLAGLLAGWLW